jgi:hypothetical protein
VPFTACIAEAQAAGEIAATFDPTDLANFCWPRGKAQSCA